MNMLVWLQQSPWVIGLACYLLLNVAKRMPPPSDPVLLSLWELAERFMFLGWDRWGGELKLPGTVHPGPKDGL
jgi:hypothetical protein